MPFYITDTYDGRVVVTSDEAQAKAYAQAEEFFVVNSDTNKWLQPDGTETEVQPARIISEIGEEDDA